MGFTLHKMWSRQQGCAGDRSKGPKLAQRIPWWPVSHCRHPTTIQDFLTVDSQELIKATEFYLNYR